MEDFSLQHALYLCHKITGAKYFGRPEGHVKYIFPGLRGAGPPPPPRPRHPLDPPLRERQVTPQGGCWENKHDWSRSEQIISPHPLHCENTPRVSNAEFDVNLDSVEGMEHRVILSVCVTSFVRNLSLVGRTLGLVTGSNTPPPAQIPL